jgi:spore maturation protein CgeB
VRVLIVGKRFPDSFADNLVTSLQDGGHEAFAVSPFPGAWAAPGPAGVRLRHEVQAVPRVARRLQDHVVARAVEYRADLTINLDSSLHFSLVRPLRRATAAPVALWYPDSPGTLARETHVLAGYDALFLKDSAVVERYRTTLGLNAHFLPEACNPRWHRPLGEPAPVADRPSAVMAGNMYATRYVLARELAARGVELKLYGPAWPRWLPRDEALESAGRRGYIAREEKARAFRHGPVVLNSLASHEADGLNCRVFEAAACGAVVLTEWRDRLPSFFDVPGEVRAYRTLDELLEHLVALCRASVGERSALGNAAARRAHAEHSYLHRFEVIRATLGRG